jgi:hypothetical protein
MLEESQVQKTRIKSARDISFTMLEECKTFSPPINNACVRKEKFVEDTFKWAC